MITRITRSMFLVVFLSCIVTGPLSGQDAPNIVGDWKGALDVNGTVLHLVLHVANGKSGLTASVDSIDQGAMGLPVDSIRQEGLRLEFEMNQLNARFKGTWNATSSEYAGEWQQGQVTLPLSWKRASEGESGKK